MLVATPGIIVSYQIAFGIAGGTSPGTSNVGGNGMPAQQPLKGGGTGPANGQGICYGQGAGLGTGNTQINNQGGPHITTAANGNPTSGPVFQKNTRDATCPASPGAPSGH
jgi:hypothetical protein